MTIAVVGSSNIDFAARVTSLPTPGQTVLAKKYSTGAGGKGCNQAVAVARLGVQPTFISKIGDDMLGNQLVATLRAEGLDVENLIIAPDIQTGMALISIEESGENMITVAGGANMTMTREDVNEKQDRLHGCDILMLQLECPVIAIDCAMKHAREGGAKIMLDPAPVPDRVVLRDLMALTDIITPNVTECRAMTGILPEDAQTASEAAKIIHEMGPATVIIKMGGIGAFYSADGQSDLIPAFNVTAIDTVGAGDSFNAGLAVALYKGQSLPDAVRFACASGALATTRPGAAEAAPTLEQVTALMDGTA